MGVGLGIQEVGVSMPFTLMRMLDILQGYRERKGHLWVGVRDRGGWG